MGGKYFIFPPGFEIWGETVLKNRRLRRAIRTFIIVYIISRLHGICVFCFKIDLSLMIKTLFAKLGACFYRRLGYDKNVLPPALLLFNLRI